MTTSHRESASGQSITLLSGRPNKDAIKLLEEWPPGPEGDGQSRVALKALM